MTSKPQLLCWATCDGVHVDPASGKHYILGIFSNIRARSFPVQHPGMIMFLTLTDVSVGKHKLLIKMGLEMEEPKPLSEREFESQSPLHRINLVNQVRNLVFSKPGNYSIFIEIDDETLLVSSLNVSE